jgi:hypothetical protein
MHPGSLFLGFALFEFSCSSNTQSQQFTIRNKWILVRTRTKEGSLQCCSEFVHSTELNALGSSHLLTSQVTVLLAQDPHRINPFELSPSTKYNDRTNLVIESANPRSSTPRAVPPSTVSSLSRPFALPSSRRSTTCRFWANLLTKSELRHALRRCK